MSVADLFEAVHPRYPELKGKVAIVTGSNQGIGLGIAVRLASEQMRVVIAGLEADEVGAVVKNLRGLGVEVEGVPGDLADDNQIVRLVDETVKTFGRIDVLVNNAADLLRVRLAEVNRALLDRQIAINLRAPLLLAQRAAAIMSGGSSIINISSVGGLRAHEDAFPYDVTKGALDSMTRALAIDLAAQNIRVNAVAPGSIMTWRARRHIEIDSKSHYHDAPQRIPLGRRGTVVEIGGVAAFLASDDAAYITGQVIYVDGGITAQLSPPGQPI
jgi:NAD(P)-dependent dehydrogenase (short-subunit alcohol dehydrogenase family)